MAPVSGNLLLFVIYYLAIVEASLETCFQMDSISCLQMQIYKTAKAYFDRSNIELAAGLTITKHRGRQGKTLEAAQRVASADAVEERQLALEDYFLAELAQLWSDGAISWSPTQTARTLIDSIPAEIKTEINKFAVVEGRGKQKKQMKMLLPLLIGIKLKLAALGALAYMAIAIIAKKAVLAGVISLLVSGFIAVKNLIESHRKQADLTPFHTAGWDAASWQLAAAGGGYDHDLLGSYTKQQQVAYAAANKKAAA